MGATRRVLGIDTSLRSTGFGVVEAQGSRLKPIAQGTIRIPRTWKLSACLRRLHQELTAAIQEHHPDAAAVEGVFFSRNAGTALILGEARGTAILACAAHDLPVYEYAPRRVKQSLVGSGGADKSQVRRMVMTLLGLGTEPQEDAGDALAIAVCHLHTAGRHAALQPDTI